MSKTTEHGIEISDTSHLFVDEAGDPELFQGRRGKVIVDTLGCSRYFLLGKLEVEDPEKLAEALTTLRLRLIADPYFAGVESFKPERRRTALGFHAKNDLPEVRFLVFDLLRSFGKALRFHCVVRDKLKLADEEIKKREADPAYRYHSNDLYDALVRSLFGKFHRMADTYDLCVAKRGKSDRNAAIREALLHAERDFESKYGFQRGGDWKIEISNPVQTACLQAVDYLLWAVQRFYEMRIDPRTGEPLPREDRYLQVVAEQLIEIHDLDYGPKHGTFYKPTSPLTVESRFPEPKKGKKKKPRV